jgi:Fe-S-cluster containining protein
VLHDLVPLDEDEFDRAARLHLPIWESPHRLAFRIPCPRLDGARCTVYAERPRTCATYACETLRAYGAGEIEMEEARARIERMRTAAPGERATMRKTWFDP